MIVTDGFTKPNYDASPRILKIINERKGIIAACITLTMVAAFGGYLRAPAQYLAEAVLVLDVRKLQGLPSESVVSALPQESPVLRTELDIINSRMMAERVLTILDRQGFPPPTSIEPTTTPAIASAMEARLPLPAATDPGTRSHSRAEIDALLSELDVLNDGRSYTIYISFRGDNREYAAAVPNAFGQAYREYQVDLQNTAIHRVGEWLGQKLISLRSKLEQSEGTASNYREKAGLVLANGMTLQAQQISALNAELAALRAKLAGTKARLATAVEAAKGKSGKYLTEMLASSAIQQLRSEDGRIERLIGELYENNATKSAQLPQLISQRAALRAQIQTEVEQIVDSLRNEIDVMQRQQDTVEGNIQQIQDSMAKTNDALVHADQLDREASANRAIYESYLTRYKQTIEQDGIAAAEAHIISPAVPPRSKANPRLAVWLAGGGALGLGLGLLAAFLADATDKRVRSLNELEAATGTPIIAVIPKLSIRERNESHRMVSDGRSHFGRSLADLQAYLRLSAPTKRAILVAVTSATEQEGKTLVVAGLARSVAASGLRTIIVDANLRNPMIAKEFGARPSHHLEEVIRGIGTFRDAIHHEASSSVDFIAARPCAVPSEFLLGNERFSRLLDELKEEYDLILVDTPALSVGADAIRIASLADMSIFVVHREKARADHVVASLGKLSVETTGHNGIVLNCGRKEDRLFGFSKPHRGNTHGENENRPVRPRRAAMSPNNVRGV